MPQTDNPEALKTVDSALFVVALDDEKPSTVEGLTRQFLLGDGRNRWFDKSYVRWALALRGHSGELSPRVRCVCGCGCGGIGGLTQVFAGDQRQRQNRHQL